MVIAPTGIDIYRSEWLRGQVVASIARQDRRVRGLGLDREDLVSDFTLRLLPSLAKFRLDGGSSITSFIHRCARSFLIDQYRSATSRHAREARLARPDRVETEDVPEGLLERMVALRLRIDGANARPAERCTYTPGQRAAIALLLLTTGVKAYKVGFNRELMLRMGISRPISKNTMYRIKLQMGKNF